MFWSVGQLDICHQDLNELPSSGVIPISGWTIFSVRQPFDPKVTNARLDFDKDNVLTLHVLERDNQGSRSTEFKKIKGKWDFEITSSVTDK